MQYPHIINKTPAVYPIIASQCATHPEVDCGPLYLDGCLQDAWVKQLDFTRWVHLQSYLSLLCHCKHVTHVVDSSCWC